MIVPLSLSAISAVIVAWKATTVLFRILMARRIAREFEEVSSFERVWQVTEKPGVAEMDFQPVDPVKSALKILSKVYLEAYLVDRKTRDRIDHSFAILLSRLSKPEDGLGSR